ncbi:MAG: transcriptional repressor [Epsilonproteobacteria bacterium]|nr:transcriptional repressor [Campylobacterota bacterium]
MQDISALLQNSALKITPQRLTILSIIRKYGHIAIDELYEQIRSVYPTISLATVYKNINALQDANIIAQIHPQMQKPKFELKKQQHGHFICKVCQSVYDFKLQNICSPNLDIIDDIEEKEVYLYGVCKKCKGE